MTIQLEEGILTATINPQTCTYGCTSCTSDNDVVNSGVLSQSVQLKHVKLAHSGDIVNETPIGLLCKALVYQVESGTSIDVAASSIMINASSDESPPITATGRPRRSCKARGNDVGVYSVEDIEMALDGNLAHLRLLLHQFKGKKLYGQRLFLFYLNLNDVEVKELTHEDNLKTMHDLAIIHGLAMISATDSVASRTVPNATNAVITWFGSGVSVTQASVAMPSVPSDPITNPAKSIPGPPGTRSPN
jgi:hypothetical protein